MRNSGKLALIQAVVASLLVIFAYSMAYGVSLQEEFDQLCIYTQDAESLSLAKLNELVAKCDQLHKKIEGSDDDKKKLLLFRLNKCRNFFVYMIDLKQGENSGTMQ
jgi:hypothetical protein